MRNVGFGRWLTGLLVGLLALGGVLAPGQNARMALERATFALAYAMPDGTLPAFCEGAGVPDGIPARHLASTACDACLLMAAPGLAAAPVGCFARVCAAGVQQPVAPSPGAHRVAGAGPPPVRAPPQFSMA
ncbi:MAG: hypothetical protein U1E59_07235 [Amaricoccus sp.]